MEQLQSNWLEAKVASQAEFEAQIADVNARLDRYTSSITQHDYALAIASGVLCGAIDSLYVGELKVTQRDIGDAHEQVNRFVENFANQAGFQAEPGKKAHLKDRVEFLENKFKVAQDSVYVNNTTHISHKDHHLADLAHHPTPVGLMSAIVVQFLRVGTFVNREGKWFFVPVDKSPQEFAKNLAAAWMPAIVAGLLNWLVTLAKDHLEERNPEMPEALWKLVRLIASTPLLVEVLGVATNWFGHMMSDVAGSKQTSGGGMGIPGVFLSLMYEVAAIPGINKTGLLQTLDTFYKSPDYKFNLRKELAYVKAAEKQMLPVALNELFVRTFYFVRRLQKELNGKTTFDEVNWKAVLPFNNRTVDQMITVSSLTFSFADTADAAVRSAIESGGNFVLFSGKFACRFNYVGAGRAVVAVGKELSNEKKEAQLIHEKRLLVEAKTQVDIELIIAYRAELEKLVTAYIAEKLETVQMGFSVIDQGIAEDDIDKFLQGNRYIQEAFGKQEVQFGTQAEFDEFMDSDEALKL